MWPLLLEGPRPPAAGRRARARAFFASTWPGRVVLAAFVLWLADGLLSLFGRALPDPIGVPARIVLWLFALWLAWRAFRWVSNRLLWRIRTKLIVSYLFIALVPVVLLTLFMAVGGVLLLGLTASRVVTGEHDRAADVLQAGDGREIVPGAGGATAYLAHRRLAILDRTDAGRQPMVSACDRHWITYNGEIYNHRDLRPLAEAGGVTLRYQDETEVLLELLAREGADAVGRCRGMFAFAWWEPEHARLTLVRDRFGIKPLVWVRPSEDLLLFASTPQALEASGLWRLRAAPGRRAEFLACGSLPVAESYWDGVQVVAPGALVTVDARRTTSRTYWSIDGVWRTERGVRSVAEVAPAIRSAIEDSVAAHLVSDVPCPPLLGDLWVWGTSFDNPSTNSGQGSGQAPNSPSPSQEGHLSEQFMNCPYIFNFALCNLKLLRHGAEGEI